MSKVVLRRILPASLQQTNSRGGLHSKPLPTRSSLDSTNAPVKQDSLMKLYSSSTTVFQTLLSLSTSHSVILMCMRQGTVDLVWKSLDNSQDPLTAQTTSSSSSSRSS